MDCPAPQPQPAAGNKNWLDRLCASRGFPPADGLDLGSFLSLKTADDLPKPHAVSRSRGDRRSKTVTDILNDSFVMGGGGDDCERFREEGLRKQQNPRFFNGMGWSNSKKSSNGGCSSDADEDVDLRGYSKNEVTVIDSSAQGWKSDMYVFRKSRNEWKVREKKGKLRSSMDVRKKTKSAKPKNEA